MQDYDKTEKFKEAVGEVFKELRCSSANVSLNKIANEYEFDKGSLSKIERGYYNIQIMTAWKLCETYNIPFSEFAKRLEAKLGKNFKIIEE